MKTIRVSDSTYTRLLQRARSFDDTPDDVLARLLDAHPAAGADAPDPPGRAAPGSILPEREYWPVILEVLSERGGASHANDVIEAVGSRLQNRLNGTDLDALEMGEVRWRNRVRFARLRMKERGLISDSSPRGIWEITDLGLAYLEESDE